MEGTTARGHPEGQAKDESSLSRKPRPLNVFFGDSPCFGLPHLGILLLIHCLQPNSGDRCVRGNAGVFPVQSRWLLQICTQGTQSNLSSESELCSWSPAFLGCPEDTEVWRSLHCLCGKSRPTPALLKSMQWDLTSPPEDEPVCKQMPHDMRGQKEMVKE
jgi:hypothetical protein